MGFSLIHKKDMLTTEGIIPEVKDEVTVGLLGQIAANTLSLASDLHPGIVYFYEGTMLSVSDTSTGTLFMTKGGHVDDTPIFSAPPIISIGLIDDGVIYLPTPYGTCTDVNYYQAWFMPPNMFCIYNHGMPTADFLVSAVGW